MARKKAVLAESAGPDRGVLLAVLLLAFYSLFLLHKINLVTADLGRHLRNGEAFFHGSFADLRTNYYSYTEPDFPCLNHHWGTGVIFYAVWKLAGFGGLELFFAGLNLAALCLFCDSARQESSAGLAGLCCLLVLPLLAERTEIRPEAFSYLFMAVFFKVLSDFRSGRIDARRLLMLPWVEILWVNTHIYFIFGLAMIGAFWVESLFDRERPERFRQLGKALALAMGAAFLNPFGWRGAIAPAEIFKNYGYRLAENQPVWFMEKMQHNPNFLIFKVAFGVMVLSFVLAWWRGRRFSFADLGLGALFGTMGWLAIRNFEVFGLFAAAFTARNLAAAFKEGLARSEVRRRLRWAALASLAVGISLTWFGKLQAFFPYWREPGLGLEPGNSRSAEFFNGLGIKGPVFNNYDIGGYLIYYLFPRERVFVDNRPEAYSEAFFEKEYVPMQEEDRVWRVEEARWRFNAIFFHRRDLTPWGQTFLIKRVQDADWAPVFVDDYTIIFLKRDAQNSEAIRRYELPKSMFTVSRPS